MTVARRVLQVGSFSAAMLAASLAGAAEYYYSLDSAVLVVPSNKHISIQFDTTAPMPKSAAFFENHPCLDDTVAVNPIGRGFSVYGIANGYDFDSAYAELVADPVVNRCIPVLTVVADTAEIPITDLISVQFTEDVSVQSALSILAEFGLHFVDSSAYHRLFWRAALDDTIPGSPLAYANALHLLDETEWATPTMCVHPRLAGAPPVDPYFEY